MSPPGSAQAVAVAAAASAPFRVGIDGGGSGTRARLQDAGWQTLGEGSAGPSGLGQGVAQAWRHVDQAIAAAFNAAALPLPPPGGIALSLGLAGASVSVQRADFLAADPGHALCLLDTDAATQLVGAHGGQPGVVLAAGTGSVAAARHADGSVQQVGGWGFPVGDEGSGAWLGLRAVQHAQAVLDGRTAHRGPLAQRVLAAIGADGPAVLAWCAVAGQHAYAQLAPAVFAAAADGDLRAQALLQEAADALAALVLPLQPRWAQAPDTWLPVVLCGSVGMALAPRLPAGLRARLVQPQGDSADGALQLLRQVLDDGAAQR